MAAAALAAPALLIGACDRAPPTGQVVATVNGVEITLAELNAEGRARQWTIGTDRAQRDVALADLIKRKLLVQAATASGVQRTPDFILAERRLREVLLAQYLLDTELAEQSRRPGADTDPAAADRLLGAIIAREARGATVRYQRGFEPLPEGK